MSRVLFAALVAVGSAVASPVLRAADESPDSQGVVQAAAKDGDTKPAVYLLRYRFKQGDKLAYKVTQTSTSSLKHGDAQDIAKMSLTTRKHLNVVAVKSNGHAVLEPVIDHVRMWKQHNDGKKYTFDSKDKGKPTTQFAGVARTIGVPLVRIEVSSRGKLINATPLLRKDVLKQVVKNNGKPKPKNDASKNFLIVFPEKPLRVGDRWTDSDLKVSLRITPRLRRDFVILRTYKLESVVKGIATIKLTMAPKTAIREPNLRVQIVQQLLSGRIEFDIVRGEITSRTLSVDDKVYGFVQGKGVLHAKSQRVEQIIRNTAAGGSSATKN